MERRGEILRLRDRSFASNFAAPQKSFIISIDPLSHPSDFRIFTHDNKPEFRLYKSTRQFNDTPSAVLGEPLRPGTNDVHIVVPYGKEDVVIPCSSDIASTLFVWKL